MRSRVIRALSKVISIVLPLATLLIATHEPPSRDAGSAGVPKLAEGGAALFRVFLMLKDPKCGCF